MITTPSAIFSGLAPFDAAPFVVPFLGSVQLETPVDPTQPDVDACDDCKCITRKDSDGAGRTSSFSPAPVFFFFFLLGVL